MTGQATEVTTEEVQDVQPVSEDDLLDSVADGLLEDDPTEDQPEEEVKEEKPVVPDQAAEEKPELHKVKVDGQEQEISYDELVKGYQTNRHNTQTAQQLADERRQLSPIYGLAKRLNEDKDFAQHVFNYGKQESDNPIDQIKQEAKADTLKEVDKRFEEDRKRQHFQEIERVRSKMSQDPDYEKVHAEMKRRIESLPAHLQKQEMVALNHDRDYYLKTFADIKEALKPKEEEPEPKKPPVLVETGITKETPVQSITQKKLDKKRAKMLASGDFDALEDYFSSPGGLIDSLDL